jgi:histidine triad (HIT) family protein
MNHDNCIFCKIASGKLNTELLFEDDRVVAFNDVNPQAPHHVLIIPRSHFESIKPIDDENLIGHMFSAAKQTADKLGLSDYRLVINTGPKAGQSVFHLHLHLLGGRPMTWPPG